MKKYLYIFITIFSILLLQELAGFLFIKKISNRFIDQVITDYIYRIENDLKYVNEFWDIKLYNSDPKTSYPNAPSQFPVYIITADGFVIERSSPINGFMDTSDMKHLLTYRPIQTITSPTKERWRVLSQPIISGGRTLGVITVAHYQPSTELINIIDNSLLQDIATINSKIKIKDGVIDTEEIDGRMLSYETSYEIVDHYNKILLNHGRTPSYIDPSYLKSAFYDNKLITIVDQKTNEEFLLKSKIMYDNNNIPIAFIASAKPISQINKLSNEYFLITCFASFFTSLLLALVVGKLGWLHIPSYEKRLPKKIIFNDTSGILTINEDVLEFLPDSYQYRILKLLFLSPEKVFEQEEVLKTIGVPNLNDNWRKIYDAATAINKKSGIKLIVYKNKTYSLNKEFIPYIVGATT